MNNKALLSDILVAFAGRPIPSESDWTFVHNDDEQNARRELAGKDLDSAVAGIVAGRGKSFGGLLALRGDVFAYYLPAYVATSFEIDNPSLSSLCSTIYDLQIKDHAQTLDWLRISERSALFRLFTFALSSDFPRGERTAKRNRLQAVRYFGYWYYGLAIREWDNVPPESFGQPISNTQKLISGIRSIVGSSDSEALRISAGRAKERMGEYGSQLSDDLVTCLTDRRSDPMLLIQDALTRFGDGTGGAANKINLNHRERVVTYLFIEYLLLEEVDYALQEDIAQLVDGLEYMGRDWQHWHRNRQ